jgi:hypothetical protein
MKKITVIIRVKSAYNGTARDRIFFSVTGRFPLIQVLEFKLNIQRNVYVSRWTGFRFIRILFFTVFETVFRL